MNDQIKNVCNPDTCSAHMYVEEAVKALEGIARKLSEGQTEIRVHLAKLSENSESVSRLHSRIDALEDKIEVQQKFVYKLIGGISVAVFVIPLIVGHFI